MKFRVVKPFLVGLIFLVAALTVLAASKEIRDNMINIAEEQLGQFYEMDTYTGGWPPGFDCSGLVSYSYFQAGVKGFSGTTPSSHGPNTTALVGMSDPVLGELYPGDLIFLNGTYDKNLDGVVNAEDLYTHVGIYAGKDAIIHAGSPVQKAKLSGWKNSNKFAGARRIKSQYWPNNDNGYNPENQATIPPTKAISEPPVNPTKPNPFQDLYDFYPQGGKIQTCIKNGFGDKFFPAYNGELVSKEIYDAVQSCFNSIANTLRGLIESSPLAFQQCIKDALGVELEKILDDPSYRSPQNPESEKKMEACQAVREATAKIRALEKYISGTAQLPGTGTKTPTPQLPPPASVNSIIPVWFELRELGNNGTFVPTALNSGYLKNVNLNLTGGYGEVMIELEFTPDGTRILGEITERNIGKPIAFYIDGKQIGGQPMVMAKITGSTYGLGDDKLSEQEAKLLVERLNAGRGLTVNPRP